ncbi:ATP-binding protein [Desulfovibrio ferrophilus]|uniref:histidine kinase n=1 Tax=Desulfovibrio ferrophilus TaxID=241368 RepID=A0A2Z6B0Y3_9BACT|nr:ATP-binding protein [Desulfovibrio ferrophilus]BBD09066.1 histidine kinase [Desulfovibrio ferrophilus]
MISNDAPSIPQRPFRMVLISVVIYAMFVATFVVWYTQRAEDQILADIDSRLLVSASALKHILAKDFHDRTTDKDSISYQEELSNRERFNAFVRESGLNYAYTIIEEQGRYYFSAPTVTPEEAEEIRRWYYYPYREIPNEFVLALENDQPVYLTYTDEWGTFRSVALPELSPAGRRYLACADFAVPKLEVLLHNKRWEAVAIGILFLLFSIPFIIAHRTQNSRYSSVLKRTNAQLRRHKDQLEQRVKLRTEELQKAKEHAEEAERTKSRFLAVMSHEIRTPLNTILGMAEVLDAPSLSPRQRRGLKNISDAGGHLLELVTDILDISRIESGIIELEERPFDLFELLQVCARVVRNAAGGKAEQLGFDINLDPAIPPFRVGDPMRLRQVLVNLLSNAYKFTSQGKIELSVTPQGEHDLHFVVHDTGIGIPADKLVTIFEDFTQADPSTTREYGGTGLGLSICRRLVEAMAGQLWVDSVLDQGSSFHFTLPLPVTEYPLHVTTEGRKNRTAEEVPPIRTLVAEDLASNYEIIELFLEGTPAKPERAVNGREAVEKALSGQYGLVLMDIQMPEMDGLEAVLSIRKQEQERGLGRLPIIALTADALPSRRREAMDVGCDEVLTKPLTRSELLAAMSIHAHITAQTTATDMHPTGASTYLEPGIQALLPIFHEELEEGLLTIEQWIEQEDFDKITRMAHGLKGAARSYGLPELGRQMGTLEQAALARDSKQTAAALHTAKAMSRHSQKL